MNECKCSMRTRLVGDGCEICNPELARDIERDNFEEDEIGHLCTQIQQNITLSLIPPTAEYYADGRVLGNDDGGDEK